VKLMGAVQPFISGAISKTGQHARRRGVEDVEELHLERGARPEGCWPSTATTCEGRQPLSTQKKGGETGSPEALANAARRRWWSYRRHRSPRTETSFRRCRGTRASKDVLVPGADCQRVPNLRRRAVASASGEPVSPTLSLLR